MISRIRWEESVARSGITKGVEELAGSHDRTAGAKGQACNSPEEMRSQTNER